ncbi:SusC/RagA family TonB-linked outer membrane protein [Bacteroidia bacterium]|nr:SusC/RagA family TonB-linked outer membrane protein [Bacteroidia bacterium]
MKNRFLYTLLVGLVLCCQSVLAQDGGDMVRGKVIGSDNDELIGATVLEIDANDRIVSTASTDISGEFALKIKNSKNRLKVSYIGFQPATVAIGAKRDFHIMLKEDNNLTEVVVTAKKVINNGGMNIPANEVSFAMQRISAATFEGIDVASIDDALQGHIAGLDIVGSGNIGQGTQMRIRGVSSLSPNANPLIVINGIPREDINMKDQDFDLTSATEQQFADLLMLNPSDILDITVLKDAGSTAVWGSRGANGVLQIQTKKGIAGPTRVNYTYKYSGAWQPEGLPMLNGDDYTMLIKQAYFNPQQNNTTSDIKELAYDRTWSEYPYYNNNTDWRKAVTQYGETNDHYLVISGGGDRAKFRVTGGYMNKKGTIIGQNWDRLTSRTTLDYQVSSRILFTSEFSFTYSDNDYNWSDGRGDHDYANGKSILDIAYKKMPNLSIYNKDITGKNVPNSYYNMLTSNGMDKQQWLRNPVAQARLATNNEKRYDIQPTLRLRYDLIEPTESMLRYEVYVTFQMNNSKTHKFLPKELSSDGWSSDNINRIEDNDSEAFGLQSENKIIFRPKMPEKHSLQFYGAFSTEMSEGNRQEQLAYGSPKGINDASAGGFVKKLVTGLNQSRKLGMTGQVHYAFDEKYILDLTFRRDGSTRFGDGNKWGNFPGLSARWNISDEHFMDWTDGWLTMLSLRPSWGISGRAPDADYMHFNRYKSWSSYAGAAAMVPDNIRLANLKWEKTQEWNMGFDLDLWEGKATLDANVYSRHTSDLLFEKTKIPNSSGYDELRYRNGGAMDNKGWEVNAHGSRFINVGDFSMDAYFNLSNSINTLSDLEADLLANHNPEFNYDSPNGNYQGRIQTGHAYGSIYGFRYKGVYTHNAESYSDALAKQGYTFPIAHDKNGEVIYSANGKPLPVYFNYGPNGRNYVFQGGDAIYEDINHDGNIDALDVVYLGSSNPLLSGGFGVTLRWKKLSVNGFFNFRYGNKVINKALMDAENMYEDYNQTITTNWRWRREGDITDMPRALHQYGFNWLASDRYVEDGSFLRFKYLTFNYSVPTEFMKKLGAQQANIYLTINNLAVWTKYRGVDPEVGYGSLGVSKDEATTPRSKDFTLGLSVGF